MADILLSVGLQKSKAEFDAFIKDIDSMAQQAAGGTPKISVGLQISSKAMDAFRKELSSMISETGDLKITLKSGGEVTAELKEMGAAADRAKEKLSQALRVKIDTGAIESQINSVKNKFNELGGESVSPSVSGKIADLEKYSRIILDETQSANERNTAYNYYKEILSQVNAELRNLASTEKEEEKNQNKQIATITKLTNLQTSVEKAQSRLVKAGQGDSSLYAGYDEVNKKIETLKENLGSMSESEINKALAGISLDMAKLGMEAQKAGNEIKKVPNGIDAISSRIVRMFSLAGIFTAIVREIKAMVKEAISLDSAMTQLRIVTDGTSEDYAKFGDQVAKTAKDLGASMTDLIDSTTVFARLGYSLDEASILSSLTAMLQNVGDIDVTSAQNAITAITKAFGLLPEEVEGVMDKLVAVGNNFPISVAELAEGLNNAGSALSAAGNSFENSVALLTAANTTVQNISKASTGLRTIAARIRGTKVELEELGEVIETPKYEAAVDALTRHGVALRDTNNEYRSTYDIMQDIAGVWDELTNLEQAAIAEQLAGNRQQNIFYSIVTQFKEAQNAMVEMENSGGTLQASYAEYLDSIQAHANSLKAAFQDLSRTAVNSDMAKFIVDLGTGAVGTLTTIIGLLDKIGGILPIIAGFVSTIVAHNFDKIVGSFTSIAGVFSGPAGWIGLAVSGLTTIISLIVKARAEAKQSAMEAVTAFSEAGQRITGSLSTIGSLSAEFAELSKGVDENGKNVKLTEEEYARYLEIVNQIVDIAPEVVRGYDDQGNAILDYTNLVKDATEALYEQAKAAREAAVAGAKISWSEYSKNYTNGQSPITTGSIGRLGVAFAKLIGFEKEGNERLQETAKILKEVGIIVSDDLLDESSSAYRGSIESLLGGNVDTIYENRDAILAHIASLKDENGQYVYSKEAIDGLRTALYGLSDAYNNISSAESSAVDLLYAWAQTQVGDQGYFDKIPLNQINAFKDGIAGIMDLNLSWAENKTAVDNYGNSWLRLTNMSSDIIKAFNDQNMTAEEFEATMSRLEASTSEVAKEAFFDYIRSAYLMEDANDAAAESTERVTTAAERFAESLRTARSNLSALQEKLNGGDLDDDYDTVREALEKAQELIKNGEVGSAQLGYIKDFFGIGDLDASQAKAYFDAIQKYFTEGKDGVALFMDELARLSSTGELDSSIASVTKIGDEVHLAFDSDRVGEFAAALGMSQDVLLALLEKFSMYSENFHIDGKTMEQINAGIEAAEDEKDITINITNQTAIDNWLSQKRTMEVSVNLTRGVGGALLGNMPERNANGTFNAKRGMSLLGDEWSPGGQPKPELVVGKDGAYLAGTQGPTVGYLNSGDQVYPYDETKKILNGRGITKIPAFKKGTSIRNVEFDDDGNVVLVTGSFPYNSAGGADFEDGSGSGSDSGSGSGGGGSLEKTVEEIKKEFDDLYKYHKHLVAMDQESEEDFLDWLEGAYKEAYEQGAIELDDFRKYEEEVYKGRMDLVKDYLSDLEHQIKMMTNAGADDNSIINVYLQMMEKVEKELQAARDRGLTDDDDYIQELQNNWWSYYNAVNDIREDSNDEAKDAIEDLVQYRIKMIKQELNNEKSALNDKLKYLKEFYDKQKQLLRDTADEEDYQEQQAEKRKAVSDIEAQIKQLQFDDSAAAQKRRLKLQEDLLKAKKDLEDFEKDRALEIAEKQIDTMYENQEKQIESQIDAVDKQLNDPEGLYERALRDVQNNSEALYEAMIEYNARYGSGIRDDIINMWEEAYISLKRYYDLYGEYYKDINLVNATGYTGPITGNIPKAVGGYATGTRNAQAGLKKFSENGDELIFTSANGTKYRMFQSGEKVLNANATNFLYDFAASGGAILSGFFDKAKSGFDMLRSGAIMGDVVMGDIIINGSATDKTVSEIRRAQRDGVDYLLRKFAQLNA